jgi:ferredoxin
MTVKFIREEKVYDTGECMRGLNILGHAQIIELFLGSQCGGHGECGKDRIRLSDEDQKKVNPANKIEKEFLNEAQLKAGMRIACQCFPNEDNAEITAYFGIKA